MVKTRKIKVKSIESEEMIMTMTKTVITKIIIIMMRMRIKFGNCTKIQKCQNRIKSVQVKAINICLQGRNLQKAVF